MTQNNYRRDLTGAPKLVRELIELCKASPLTFGAIEVRAGIANRALSQYGSARTRMPKVDSLIAVGQAIGYELVWRKINETE